MNKNKIILSFCVLIMLNGCTTSSNLTPKSQIDSINSQNESKEKSILSIKSALHNDQKNQDLYILLGKEYMKYNNFPDAINNFTLAINADARSSEAYNYRGEAQYLLGNFDKALSDFNIALSINPNYSQAYYNRAIYYDDLNNSKLAVINLDSAIKYNNKNHTTCC